jgi:hypothetical protein
MEHFVTLFDSNFLPQGLALHSSMERHMRSSYKLWVICLDENLFRNLMSLSLSNVAPLNFKELETPELLEVKSTRSVREYCWTLTPFAPFFIFNQDPSICRVTYLDADTWFLNSPKNIFSEFEMVKKSVLITEHAYSQEHDQTALSGKYCVQFMIFFRDEGENVRLWWEGECLKWCYARFENGRFGDQKYLEQFPEMFPSQVHVSRNLGAFLAPWNATRFPYDKGIIWHFHGLRIVKLFFRTRVYCGRYFLPDLVLVNIYAKYVVDLSLALKLMKFKGIRIPIQDNIHWKDKMKYVLCKYFIFWHKKFLHQNIINL